MQPLKIFAFVALTIVSIATFGAAPTAPAPVAEKVTLLDTLAPWQYPGSTMIQGATMSDGGLAGVQSLICTTVMATPDPIDQVVKYYSEKFPLPPVTGPADPKSVSSIRDTEGRPLGLHIIVVNKAQTSTTLVISRGAGEKQTHIAWLHFMRLEHQD